MMCHFFIALLLASLQSRARGLTNPSCYEVEEKVAEADKNTLIPFPPSIIGKWVSEKCETRTGPEFVLRWHHFSDNETFSAVLHRYRDLHCTEPWFSVLSHGKVALKGRSWLAQSSAQADFTVESALIVPHHPKSVGELTTLLNITCPGLLSRPLRVHDSLTVYTSKESAEFADKDGPDWTVGEKTCLKGLRLGLDESGLVRVQVRPPGPPDLGGSRTELLLGEARPKGTAFRTPLLYSVKAGGCEVCSAVDHSTVENPPRLSPPIAGAAMTGEWVSTRCELRPMGLFLRRRLRVSGRSWQADYNFFSDPGCTAPTLTASAEGSLSEVSRKRILGATDYDFRVLRAFLTLHEEGLVASLSKDGNCGPSGEWQLGVRRDVTPSSGCPALGITVPTTEYELVRLELDTTGHAMLYLGQAEQRKGGKKERPTSFQPPLLQCNAPELPPLTHFLNSGDFFNSGDGHRGFVLPLLLVVICWLL